MNIKLSDYQISVYMRWIENQLYLQPKQVEMFKNALKDSNTVHFKKSDLEFILEYCPFGFIQHPIEKNKKL